MTMCDDGSYLGVCDRCGMVTFDQQVDILGFMEDLVRMNVTAEVDLIEQVKVELAESMSWLDAEFIDSFAGLLVRQFRDQAIFNVEAEQNEKSKYHGGQYAGR